MYENTAHKITLLRQKKLHPRLWYGQFELSPFSQSQALTVAHVLRRVLLSEIETTAATAVKIENVFHELTLLPGLQESIPEVLANIRGLVFESKSQQQAQFTSTEHGHIKQVGKKVICARDIQLPESIQVVDPNQHIATLVSNKSSFSADIHLAQSKGYTMCTDAPEFSPPLEGKEKEPNPLLPLDAVFLPVTKVNYILQQHSYYESIILEIWTDGSISPQKALGKASFAIRTLFSPFTAR